MPNHADENPFDMKRIWRPHDNRLHRCICRMQFNVRVLLEVGLDGRLMINQRNNGLSVPGRLLFSHHHKIAGDITVVFIDSPLTRSAKVLLPCNMLGGTSINSDWGTGSIGGRPPPFLPWHPPAIG